MTHPLADALPGYIDDTIEFLSDVRWESFEDDYDWPRCSLAYGMAGAAFALWHHSRVTGAQSSAEAARAIADSAARHADDPRAFFDVERGAGTAVDAASLFHGRAGLSFVQARLGGAGEMALDQHHSPSATLDLYGGRAGQLLSALHDRGGAERAAVLARGLVDDVEAGRVRELDCTGMGHGRAGVYLALLLWARDCGEPVPEVVHRELSALADGGPPWPSFASMPERGTLGGLCNGAPGFVQLYALAAEVTGEARYIETATAAAAAVAGTEPTDASLCCGAVGEAYSLLAMTRIADPEPWRSLALDRTAVGLGHDQDAIGFLHGDAGALCLAIDIVAGRAEVPVLAPQRPNVPR